jgi:hypothetical protein
VIRRRSGTLYWLPLILDDDRLDAVETLLMVALADHVNADDVAWPSIATLAHSARVSYPTARRRLAGLAEKGIITRERRRMKGSGNLSTYEYRLIRRPDSDDSIDDRSALDIGENLGAKLITSQSSPRSALASDHQDERAEPPKGEPPSENNPPELALGPIAEPKTPSDPVKDRAREIVDAVWERKNPKPATPYIGCVKIAESLLHAGHDPQAIGKAMMTVPTISTRWVEAEIARSKPATRSRIIGPDDGASGVIDPSEIWGDE